MSAMKLALGFFAIDSQFEAVNTNRVTFFKQTFLQFPITLIFRKEERKHSFIIVQSELMPFQSIYSMRMRIDNTIYSDAGRRTEKPTKFSVVLHEIYGMACAVAV